MAYLLSIALIVVLSIVIIDLILWAAWKPKPQKTSELPSNLPFISILIAARNEEDNIKANLESIIALDYPIEKYEVIVGDDNSTDQTADIVRSFSEKVSNIKYVLVEQNEEDNKAKAGVLAEITKQAKGEYLFFTDADIRVPPSWIKKHLACLKNETSIQSGFTIIQRSGFFSSMQMVDWSFAMGMVKILSGWGIPVTAVGNNMLIKKEAYEQCGGYDNLPYSATEDFNLFQKIVKNGYKFQQLANSESMAVSMPANSISALLKQRKRWMTGALQLPFMMRMLLFLQAAYFPAIFILLLFNPLVGIPLFGLKTTIQSLFINKIHERVEEYIPIGHLFIFEFYSAFITTIVCFYYLLPLPLVWKGRKIKKK